MRALERAGWIAVIVLTLLGWSTNLVVAETWINVTRQPAAAPARLEAFRARGA
jgi:hypothetical protein